MAGKILSHLFEKVAVEKLAASPLFQQLVHKVVVVHESVEKMTTEAAKDPEKAKGVVVEQTRTFFDSLKSEIAKDLGWGDPPAPKKVGASAEKEDNARLR